MSAAKSPVAGEPGGAATSPGTTAATITHGRHCICSACARQDWTEPQLACCGMHGPSCPPVYAPLGAPGQPDPSAAQRRRLVKFSRVGKARTCQLHLGRLDVSFVWWSSRV